MPGCSPNGLATSSRTDLIKQAKGYELLLQHGLITYDLATKELTGGKFSKNVKKQRVER